MVTKAVAELVSRQYLSHFVLDGSEHWKDVSGCCAPHLLTNVTKFIAVFLSSLLVHRRIGVARAVKRSESTCRKISEYVFRGNVVEDCNAGQILNYVLDFQVDDAQATRHLSLAIRTGVENGEVKGKEGIWPGENSNYFSLTQFIQPKGPSGGLKLNKEHGKISSATRKPPTAAKSKAAAPVKKVSTKSAVDKPKGTKAKSTTARKVAAKKTAAKSATKKVAPKKRASPKKRTTPKMAPSLTQKKESGSAERAARAARRA
ncbi:hypothetical protein HKX48_009058 [Thoreauomyces humboldtii]|nr:hypothetical protein HKX48_009058 [Thoreauomyces humboldtii]